MPRKKKEDKIIPFDGGKSSKNVREATTPTTNQVTTITPKVAVELVDTNAVEELSVAEYNRRKEELRIKRDQVMLMVDSNKLVQATKLVKLMDNTLDQMSAILFSGEPDSRAYKEFAEAYDRMSRNLSMLSRLDTNCNGEFTEIHLTIERR